MVPLQIAWWVQGLSVAFSMTGLVFASYAVVDLGLKHRTFKFAYATSAIFILLAAAVVGFDRADPAFLLAAFMGLGWIAAAVYLSMAKFTIERFARR